MQLVGWCMSKYRTSFTKGEIQVLDFILTALMRHGTPTMALRHKEFASVAGKVLKMKQSVKEDAEKEAYEATLCANCGGEKERDHDKLSQDWDTDPIHGIAWKCRNGESTLYKKKGTQEEAQAQA